MDALNEERCIEYPSGVRYCPVQLDAAARRLYRPTGLSHYALLIEPVPDVKLSRRFPARDFMLPGYPYARIEPILVKVVESIADNLSGFVPTIVSGYRTREFNRARGDFTLSPHQDGLAVDLFCEDVPLSELYDVASAVVGQLGAVYLHEGRFVHVDIAGNYRRRKIPIRR